MCSARRTEDTGSIVVALVVASWGSAAVAVAAGWATGLLVGAVALTVVLGGARAGAWGRPAPEPVLLGERMGAAARVHHRLVATEPDAELGPVAVGDRAPMAAAEVLPGERPLAALHAG